MRAKKISSKSYEVEINFAKANASGDTDGSGVYLYKLPANLSFSTNQILHTSTSDGDDMYSAILTGTGVYLDRDNRYRVASAVAYDATHIKIIIPNNDDDASVWNNGWHHGFSNSHAIKLRFIMDVD